MQITPKGLDCMGLTLNELQHYCGQMEDKLSESQPDSHWMLLAAKATVVHALTSNIPGGVLLQFCKMNTRDDPTTTLLACEYAAKNGHAKAAQRCLWSAIRPRLNKYYECIREVANFKKAQSKSRALAKLAEAYQVQLPTELKGLAPWFDVYRALLVVTKDKTELSKFEAVVAHVESGQPKPVLDLPVDSRSMNEETFWSLITEAAVRTLDLSERCEKLIARLTRFKKADIVKFSKLLHGFIAQAYRYDLLAVATIVNDGSSDDGFEYFLAWLVFQGQQRFEATIADPSSIVSWIKKGQDSEAEELLYVAAEAYAELSGDELPESAFGKRKKLTGTKWVEGDLPKMFPALCKKFR
jgi:hypothetical protein